MSTLQIGPDSSGQSVFLKDGRVVPELDRDANQVIDCPKGTLAPGRVNAHTHLYSGLAPLGIPAPEPPPENFVQILERLWWKLDVSLDAHTLRAGARYYVAKALLKGCTALVDHHESPNFIHGSLDVLGNACTELGMRALLCYGATDRNRGTDEGTAGLNECERFIEKNHDSRIKGMVGLHASFTASDETMRRAGDMCRALNTGLHIHVAEDGADVVDAQKRGYSGPVERLLAMEAIQPGSLLIHGVHLSPEQIELASKRGCWFTQNPRSNANNKVGYPSGLAASERVALGTDGFPADMVEESEALHRIGAEEGDEAAVLDARIEGSRRLMAEMFATPVDPFEEGALGDWIVLSGKRVLHVVVDGEVVVRDGLLVAADIEQIEEEAARVAPHLWERMARL